MATEPTVFVVDDDQAVRDALSQLLKAAGLKVNVFVDAKDFLRAYTPDQSGCVLLDVRMPGMSGLDLQQNLAEHGIRIPIIIITGHADIPMAVRAMKAGALDFIEKPFNNQLLLERIREALTLNDQARRQQAIYNTIAARIALLSTRELEVLERVVAGQFNKVIATELGISVSTVEAHRKKIMKKLQAESLSDLVRMLSYYQLRKS